MKFLPDVRWLAILFVLGGAIGAFVTAMDGPWWIWFVGAVAMGLVPTPEWAKSKPSNNEEDK